MITWIDVVVEGIEKFQAQNFVNFVESISKDDVIHGVISNNNDTPDTGHVSSNFFSSIKEIIKVWSIQKDLSLIQKTTALKCTLK